jgi:putative PIN family toxin of toxin-antitoxin system
MRLVLDTNVVLSALLWKGLPNKLIDHGSAKHTHFFSSTALLTELTDVLSRSKLARRIAASRLSVPQHVLRYINLTVLVVPQRVPRIAPDPDDDVVLGTALAAKADFIVTGDRALPSVVQFQGIRIVSVAEALEAIG